MNLHKIRKICCDKQVAGDISGPWPTLIIRITYRASLRRFSENAAPMPRLRLSFTSRPTHHLRDKISIWRLMSPRFFFSCCPMHKLQHSFILECWICMKWSDHLQLCYSVQSYSTWPITTEADTNLRVSQADNRVYARNRVRGQITITVTVIHWTPLLDPRIFSVYTTTSNNVTTEYVRYPNQLPWMNFLCDPSSIKLWYSTPS